MSQDFLVAAGSVIGRDHQLRLKNNQDAFYVINEPDLLIGVVSDGCGDNRSLYSGVGASIGSRVLAHVIAMNTKKYLGTNIAPFSEFKFWEKIRQDFLSHMRITALNMGGSFTETVSSFFLFTVVGVLITRTESVFFSVGDGVAIVNGTINVLGPFANNEPPYLGYALLDSSNLSSSFGNFQIQINTVIPTRELTSFLLGSDGVTDLISAQNRILFDGSSVEDISTFWTKPIYYSNPFALTRRLTVLGKEQKVIDWDKKKVISSPSILTDDTTLIVGLRAIEDGEL